MIKYHIRKVVVATNFSEQADNALEYGIIIAKRHNATLDIIHAVSPSESRNKKPQFVSAAYEKLKEYKREIEEEHGIEPKVFARVGEITDFVYKYCVDNKIDLLIIGIRPHAKKYFGDFKAYNIIMKIECPVLSIPINFREDHFSHVLFPVRDVEGVKEKLCYAKPFVLENRSELHLVSFGHPNPAEVEQLVKMADSEGITSYIPDFELTPTKNVPSQVITTAEEKHDDLIVINATTGKEWYKIFGENYTEYILKESRIAVLSITHLFESASDLN